MNIRLFYVLVFVYTLALLVSVSGCTISRKQMSPETVLTASQRESVRVIAPQDVRFIPLNPARGDKAPQAGMLWGDIRQNSASGVLLRFADGFSSPPHIHNITYRAIVISGGLHNDDPGAALQWMESGSYWTQPAGEVHITAARPGSDATAFLEIMSGPYLVQPPSSAFLNQERPINLQSSNMVWMDPGEFSWLDARPASGEPPEATLLWGNLDEGLPSGSLLKLPERFAGTLQTTAGALKAVVIRGDVDHAVHTVTNRKRLGPGGFFASTERVPHSVTCQSEKKCVVYVRTSGSFLLR